MAFSGLQKTRLGLAAFARRLYGSFAGKEETEVVFTTLDLTTRISSDSPQLLTSISALGVNIDQDLRGQIDLVNKIKAGQTQLKTDISADPVNLETIID